jgi:hypothetical protein
MTREEQLKGLIARAWPGQTVNQIDRQKLDRYEEKHTTENSI